MTRKLRSSFHIYEIMREVLFRESKLRGKQEYFWVMGLNNANAIEYIELVATGRQNRLSATPTDILSWALQKKCSKIIMAHNHSAGTIIPSEPDKIFTKKMQAASNLMGIEIIDHLIITEKSYFSFSDMEML